MTTYLQTLTHFVKGLIGAGIFSMGIAFKNGGLMFATIFTIVMGLLVLHCATLVVRTIEYQEWQREQSKKQITKLNRTYADIAAEVFEDGPPLAKRLAKYIKPTINIQMCCMNLGFCCVYVVFVGNNMKKALNYFEIDMSLYVVMLICVIPMWLSSLITNLKWLAPVSTVANAILFAAIGITLYYVSSDLRDFKSFNFIAGIDTIPLFLAVALYSFDCMSLVLPLRNEMDEPRKFAGPFGVMNMGFLIITPLIVTLGFLPYLKYGDQIQGTVFLNLPENDILVQVLLILVCVQIIFTYPVPFYAPVTIMWPMVVKKYGPFKSELLMLLGFRTALVLITLVIAEAFPFIDLVISLIGAVCSSSMTLFLPPIFDIITSQKKKGRNSVLSMFVLLKNVAIATFALIIFSTGVFTSIRNIINSF